jgi:hypothetical protein
MVLAATTSNVIQAQHLLTIAAGHTASRGEALAEHVWETDGGHMHTAASPASGGRADVPSTHGGGDFPRPQVGREERR